MFFWSKIWFDCKSSRAMLKNTIFLQGFWGFFLLKPLLSAFWLSLSSCCCFPCYSCCLLLVLVVIIITIVIIESYQFVHLLGSTMDPSSGQTNNSPVAKLITFNLLLAAVRIRFWQTVDKGITFEKAKKVDKLITLRHTYIYIYICMRRYIYIYVCVPES